jgi:hypothetical protein
MVTDRRSLLRSALIGTALLAPGARGVLAAPDIHVDDASGLSRALAAAVGGETIRLAPGDYGLLNLQGRQDFVAPVTLTSADPAAPAVFSSAVVAHVTDLVIDGLRFDYRFTPGDKIRLQPFRFVNCRNLVIRNALFEGDVARGVSPEEDGFGWGMGLSLRGCSRLTVTGNRIEGFHRGLVIGDGTDVVVTANEVTAMRMDAMTFTSMRNVRIEGNYLHGFRRAWRSPDHCDMIQFWTNKTTAPSTDILIRGNLLQAGDGDPTQSIFMRNEEVDSGRAGSEMFYRRVTIEDNTILNGHLHGITLGEAQDVVIRRNTVLRDPAFSGRPDHAKAVNIPRINVKPASVDVVVQDNIVPGVTDAQAGWTVRDNLIVQDLGRMKPGYYGLLFAPRPPGAAAPLPKSLVGGGLAGRTSLVVRPGSAADRPGLGSFLMR